VGAGLMLLLSVLVAALQARQARLPARHDSFLARLVVAALCYAQPLVRSWARYRTRLFCPRRAAVDPPPGGGGGTPLPLSGRRTVEYWTEDRRERTELLDAVVELLTEERWGKVVDSGWSDWDLCVHTDGGTAVEVCTVQEEYGGGRRQLRVR